MWLRTDYLIELAQIWLASNVAEGGGLARARLLAAFRAIAGEESGLPFSKEDADLHRRFNLRTIWLPDYRSPAV